MRRIQTLDLEEAKDFLLDQRKLNGSKQRFDLYFRMCNLYIQEIEGIISVNARRHDDSLYMSNFWSVENFMTSVYEFIQAKHPEELTEIEIPSVSVVGNAFLPSNPYVGVTKSSHRINVVRRLTTKQMHKKHIDTHACNTLRRTVKDLLFELAQELSKSRSSEVTCLSFYGGVEEELLSVIDTNARLNIRQCFRYNATSE